MFDLRSDLTLMTATISMYSSRRLCDKVRICQKRELDTDALVETVSFGSSKKEP